MTYPCPNCGRMNKVQVFRGFDIQYRGYVCPCGCKYTTEMVDRERLVSRRRLAVFPIASSKEARMFR